MPTAKESTPTAPPKPANAHFYDHHLERNYIICMAIFPMITPTIHHLCALDHNDWRLPGGATSDRLAAGSSVR